MTAIDFNKVGAAADAFQANMDALGGMDMDSMMVMVEAKYQTLSDQFNSRMEEDEKRGAKLKTLQDAQGLLEAGQDKGIIHGTTEATNVADALDKVKAQLPDGPDKDMLQEKINYLRSPQHDQDAMMPNDVSDLINFIKTKEDKLNGDSQMNLLHIQDVVSKIQSLMSTTSQIQSTAHDMQKGIIANIRA